MKKILLALVLVVLMCGSALAGVHDVNSSDYKSADALIATGIGWVNGILINADGTNECSLRLYNAVSATGTTLWFHIVAAGEKNTYGVVFPAPIYFSTGVYADLTTSGTCNYLILYHQ